MDKYRIDSHKLIFHVQRVNDWLKGKGIFPIYVEISPAGSCNHRCVYCALDFLEYQPRFLETRMLKKRLREMAFCGVKSVMFAGEGEPFLHKDLPEIIRQSKKNNLDVAITTNGVLMNKQITDSILRYTSWIKVSINGATKETYALIHRCSPLDFKRVLDNIAYALKVKHKFGYPCALGMQLLLLPENYKEVVSLAKRAKDLGVDYLVIKPYSQHHFSKTQKYKNIKYARFMDLADKLKGFNSDNFSCIFRIQAMLKWDRSKRDYRHCYALRFWSYLDAGGNLWACSAYLSDQRFLYGNLYQHSFKDLLTSARAKRLRSFSENRLDTCECRVNCRMDEANRYLWELKHPPEHVNFI